MSPSQIKRSFNVIHATGDIPFTPIHILLKLKLTVLLSILYFFANSCSVTSCVSFMKGKASKVFIIQWFNFYQDIMTTWLSNNPVQFDDRVNVIHVDKTAVGGKHKYQRGKHAVRPHWLFGITQKDS